MWKLIGIFLSLASLVYANDDDLFTDFEEIPLEVDKDFADDFGGLETSASPEYAKGWLIADVYEPFSARDLERREKSLSVLGGNETIASTYHFTIFPQGRFEVWKIYGHFGVPLRFPIYDNVGVGSSGHREPGFMSGKALFIPRPRDFRSFWDAQRIVRHFEMGRSNEAHSIRLTRSHSVTLGQGELLKNITPDGLYDEDILFLSGHTEWDNFRIDGFLAPIARASMAGLSVRFTPFINLTAPDFVQNLNLLATYINDFTAPNHSITSRDAFVLDDERRSVKRMQGMAQGMVLGVAANFQPWSWLSLKPYLSSGHLWLSGLSDSNRDLPMSYGTGVHLGHDAIFSLIPGTNRSNLIFKTEGRLFSSGYFPSYFGSTYLIDRLVFSAPSGAAVGDAPLTKSQWLSSSGDGRFRFGYLLEMGYAYEDMVSALVGYENAHSILAGQQISPMRRVQFLTSLNLDMVKFNIGYQVTSLAQMKELFDFDKSRALLSVRGQLKILPFLYFDTWVKHAFGINDMMTSDGDALWLSHLAETRSLNFGLGLELSMTF